MKPETKKNYKIALVILFVAIGAFSIGYEIIEYAELKTTSALFIGLPMIVGILIATLTRTHSVYGLTVKISLIILCLVAPLLGEGSICILMMAPPFLAMNLFIVFLYRKTKRAFPIYIIICVPFFTGLAEKNSLTQNRKFLTVTTETMVEGHASRWVSPIKASSRISREVPFFLKMGFPLPTKISHYSHYEDELSVPFDKGGHWKVRKTAYENSVKYTLLEDTTKIRRWIEIKDGLVEVKELENQKTIIRQTTRFRSKVFPEWYFRPFQKLALRQLHQFAISSWQ
ncbi:MAG: hypothetical protein OXB88_07010 [Bacteriovoracales bacterium]|nr:hypothetical protein [Bacteriovoracales bacterium]